MIGFKERFFHNKNYSFGHEIYVAVRQFSGAAKPLCSLSTDSHIVTNKFFSVRYLEEQNQKLEKLIEEASGKKETDLGEDKLLELRRLRSLVDDATLAKVRSEIIRDNLRGEASEIKWK